MPKITPQQLRDMKGHTMACFWPSKVMGWTGTDWNGIAGNLDALLQGAEARLEFYGTATLAEVQQLRTLAQLAAAQTLR